MPELNNSVSVGLFNRKVSGWSDVEKSYEGLSTKTSPPNVEYSRVRATSKQR